MMNPEPSDVTFFGTFCGPRKSLNRSCSGEFGGRSMPTCCDFSVWLVAMFTTVGSSLPARSAKESGAGRAKTCGAKLPAATATKPASASPARKNLPIDDSFGRTLRGDGTIQSTWRKYSRDGRKVSRTFGRLRLFGGPTHVVRRKAFELNAR